jgi:hypothetical protein
MINRLKKDIKMGRVSKQDKETKSHGGVCHLKTSAQATTTDELLLALSLNDTLGHGHDFDLDQADKYEAMRRHLSSAHTLRHLIDSSSCRTLTKCDTSKVVAKTLYSKAYLNGPLETHLLVIGLIRDRVHQLFTAEQQRVLSTDLDQAKSMVRQRVREYPGAHASLEQVLSAIIQGLKPCMAILVNFCRQLPGRFSV